MALSLERMRALLRKGLGGLDEADLPDPEADELLNMSLWELEDKFDFKEKECVITTPVGAGVAEYGLPNSVDAINSVALIHVDRAHARTKLIKSSFDAEHEKADGITEASVRSIPTHYLRRNRTVVLSPVPIASNRWTLEIVMWRTVESLVEGVVDVPGLPRNWHELVVEGAVVRGHFYNEDYNIAQQASNFQTGKVRSAVSTNTKEDRDNRYAGVRVIHEFPDEQTQRKGRVR